MFEGSIVAIVTPIKNQKIDYNAFEKLIEFQIKNKTRGIVVCGCTGEPATLTMEEHKELVKYTVDVVNKRCPVIAGTGSNNTKEAIELTQEAEKAGADGVLVITPYYNKPMPQGLYQHYKKIAESVSIPVIIYNVPSRTGISILPETVCELSKIKNIVGIKEASGSLDQVSKIISLCRNDFIVLSGDDSLTLPIMAVGGKGVISVAANIVPLDVAEMVESALNGDWAKAQKIHIDLFPIFKVLFIETNPIPVKAALGLMGLITPEWRLPLTPPSQASLEKIKEVLVKSKVLK
ncbi:MAG: 4-hydroxy-tetrahydrodipicolinate synthase [Candidatus Omnitrophica bacterium]|nr:4-hydroxy-tetrahydrodipicolinate synthase [Candidatus Omnitrophota bacterium]MCM8778027.1 4-hydroxy-tetrahydrodipicolinate synthase [Candidatus Omnitrophota bacterium]